MPAGLDHLPKLPSQSFTIRWWSVSKKCSGFCPRSHGRIDRAGSLGACCFLGRVVFCMDVDVHCLVSDGFFLCFPFWLCDLTTIDE